MEPHTAKRRSEAARRPREIPPDLVTVLQSAVLEHSTASPMMILLLVGAFYVCWTQPGTLQQLRGGAGCLVWLGMLVWLVCVFFSQKGSKETPWQAAMRKLQHEHEL
eukprot:CAMPEP_0118814856 /NCGR_PEP_ID=MMETSP1162-20130426/3822_1 /TAXON_ID=33656 /ORGANISM="Phaeocystis Sp, Strain CCMP2710" /LENGTH=106 /DNA_ID=CAMNT_0006744779 /DNA_START=65 /DNA_END=385 /DNA_ORIENTATION=-